MDFRDVSDWERKAKAFATPTSVSTSRSNARSCGPMSRRTPGSRHGSSRRKTPGTMTGGGYKTPGSSGQSRASDLDRFIPSRGATNRELQLHQFMNGENENPNEDEELGLMMGPKSCPGQHRQEKRVNIGGPRAEFNDRLAESLFDEKTHNTHQRSILAFKNSSRTASSSNLNSGGSTTPNHHDSLRLLYSANRDREGGTLLNSRRKQFREIHKSATRILDAPNILDDYYLNLLDWSSLNVVGIALASSIYLWDPVSGNISVMQPAVSSESSSSEPADSPLITSVCFMPTGTHVAVGSDDYNVQLWDVETKKQLRSMKGHQGRVGALAWNSHILSSGSRDQNIFHHDVRIARHQVATLTGHTQEICGLEWSPDGTQLATGGNDNLCCIYDPSSSSPVHTFDCHQAAVKALAWCPFQANVLATGAGTSDRHIRFFNSKSGSLIQSIDSKSQVCGLQWNPYDRELLSAHGFSHNQLIVWKYPSMLKMAELEGHTSRVLHLVLSPDRTTACSAAADETLRFWDVFSNRETKNRDVKTRSKSMSALEFNSMQSHTQQLR